ncbi:MAG: putative dsRNA-binding protein, partial [Bacteroidota bacterium]
PHFRCDLLWNGEMIGSGEGGTKKEAEKNAAAAAIEKLNETNWKDLGNCIEK